MSIFGLLLGFLAGATAWTLTEYGLHRGYGHKGGSKNPFTVEHLAHHTDIMYFAPGWKKFGAAFLVLGITGPLLYLATGIYGIAASLGFALTYLTYEFIHKRLHTHGPKTRYGRWARRHHLYHHYKRPNLNHGVTTPIWDAVFGTLEVPPKIVVPRKKALPWMLNEEGEMRPEYAEDFELHSPRVSN